MKKFFKATHKETGEVIEFGLEDLEADVGYQVGVFEHPIEFVLPTGYGDYAWRLEYYHEGKYYEYK